MTGEPITHDINGREYVRLSQLKIGDKIEVDEGFDCMTPGSILTVSRNEHGLYVPCNEEAHNLNDDEGDYLIGMYPVKKEE